jgi:hypothetical protein
MIQIKEQLKIENRLVKIALLSLFLCYFSCKPTEEERTTFPTTVKSYQGEITSVSGTRKISGIYPHLTTYAHGRLNGLYGFGNECGIGGLAVWNDKLYMINYATHFPKGSEHKLYVVDKDKTMEIFEGSIGGTPAARIIHQESDQLFIGPYVIDSIGNVRVIPINDMEGRLTAIARHLKDPENMVYYYDMEGMLYEVNVHTLKVNKLYNNPLPGWHGKGAYTSQGKLVLANNGEHGHEPNKEWQIDNEDMVGDEKNGILAEYDGEHFKVLERLQFTDVTTKNGTKAIPNEQSPIWAIGWDKRALRLKVMDKGEWSTFLLPKATYNNDPSHGWFTEWPRIREIGNGEMMMDMHGMFFNFPSTFSASNTRGISPMGSHLRYIPDFLSWNNQIILGTDETSIQGNPLAGQPQSNLWFGSKEQLSSWGPSTGYGAIWLEDDVTSNKPSLPFLISGFDNRMLHLFNSGVTPVNISIQIHSNGKNEWTDLKTIKVDNEGYSYYLFDKNLKAEWVRLISDVSSNLTASFHLTDSKLHIGLEGKELFEAIADIDADITATHAKLYSNKTNYNLSVFAGKISDNEFIREADYEFTKFGFEFIKGITDTTAIEALKKQDIWKEVGFYNEQIKDTTVINQSKNIEIWEEDEASVILNAKVYRLRLPKGSAKYNSKFHSGTTRIKREVESERELANICGTFYELPLKEVGKEPLYKMMRPISTHGKQISEFNTWNGLLVLTGVKENAEVSEHVYKSDDGNIGLWFGGIDDIWSFGKPLGEGGPWKDTIVKAGELSDMYLMTGYDKKSLQLQADEDVEVSLYIHINHYLKEPVLFKTFSLKAGETLDYEFPEGFSAHWAQVKADKDCNATAWFVYK